MHGYYRYYDDKALVHLPLVHYWVLFKGRGDPYHHLGWKTKMFNCQSKERCYNHKTFLHTFLVSVSVTVTLCWEYTSALIALLYSSDGQPAATAFLSKLPFL